MTYISIRELAARIGIDKSNLLKWIKANREELRLATNKRMQTPDSGANRTIVFTEEEFERIVRLRDEQGFGSEGRDLAETGQFYIIQLVPEFDPNRIKLGFAMDVRQRLSQHRTSAPTAVCKASWPCKRLWEGTVIDYLTLGHCRLIANEVFECDDIDDVVQRGRSLFTIMPSPDTRIAMSEHFKRVDTGETALKEAENQNPDARSTD